MSGGTFTTRLMAAVKGEVAAVDLEAYQRAGVGVFEALDAAAQRRSAMLCDGTTAWTVDRSTQAQLLACWIASTCQTLGDDFVAADYEADPRTVGYVPPVTERQAMAFYAEVGDWLSASREAAANSSYVGTVTRPIRLPQWVDVEPCPVAHLHAMLAAADSLRGRVEALLADVIGATLSGDEISQLKRVQQLVARGDSFQERAQQLRGSASSVSLQLHEQIETSVKQAVEAYFVAGQLLSMPSLIASYDEHRQGALTALPATRLPGPGEAGFDMWCLTDPQARPHWQQDRAAERAVDVLWRYDPAPSSTLQIQAEIDAALADGDIVHSQLGHYFCCPWAALYQAINPVTVGGTRVRRGETFTFDVSGEEMAEGGQFVRRILVADFKPTTKIDYCNPESGGHDDD